MGATEAILARLGERFPDSLLAVHAERDEATAQVDPERIADVLRFLRDDPALGFDMLSDLCAVDHLGGATARASGRFEIVYHLYSTRLNHRVRIKARLLDANCELASAVGIWPAAGWLEREAWDLYGVHFIGHSDLRRLLLYEEFDGHPLRKDYPKRGRQPLLGPGN